MLFSTKRCPRCTSTSSSPPSWGAAAWPLLLLLLFPSLALELLLLLLAAAAAASAPVNMRTRGRAVNTPQAPCFWASNSPGALSCNSVRTKAAAGPTPQPAAPCIAWHQLPGTPAAAGASCMLLPRRSRGRVSRLVGGRGVPEALT